MSITVMHMSLELDLQDRLTLTLPSPKQVDERLETVRRPLDSGGYTAVGEVAGDDLDEGFRKTQNGVDTDSWSRIPLPGVTPAAPGYIEANGRRFGYKSTEVGDVMIYDGRAFVVDTFGFAEVTGWCPGSAVRPEAGEDPECPSAP